MRVSERTINNYMITLLYPVSLLLLLGARNLAIHILNLTFVLKDNHFYHLRFTHKENDLSKATCLEWQYKNLNSSVTKYIHLPLFEKEKTFGEAEQQ